LLLLGCRPPARAGALNRPLQHYTLPSSGSRMIFRGTEWYVIRNQRIAEVRAYYQYDESRDCQLNGFPYADRGYLEK
jgi:hypothetical protein